MGRYVVLKQQADEAGWDVVDELEAPNDLVAIKKSTDHPGTFVAVPKRSWRPRTRKVETVQRSSWG